jgi:hypothetical protein
MFMGKILRTSTVLVILTRLVLVCIWGKFIAEAPLLAQPNLLTFTRSNGPFAGQLSSFVQHRQQLFALVQNVELQQTVGSNQVSGVYRSTNNGDTWTLVEQVPEVAEAKQLISTENSLFSLLNTTTGSGRLYRSLTNGQTWQRAGQSAQMPQFTHIVEAGTDTLIARVVLPSGITNFFTSLDSGNSWNPVSQARNSINSIVSFRPNNAQNRAFLLGGSVGLGLFRSFDKGSTWQPVMVPIQNQTIIVFELAATSGDTLVIATNQGIFASVNQGASWQTFSNGLEGNTVFSVTIRGTTVLAGTSSGLYAAFLSNLQNTSQNSLVWRKVNIPELSANEAVMSVFTLNDAEKTLILGSNRGVFRAIQTAVPRDTNIILEEKNIGLPSYSFQQRSLVSASSESSIVIALTEKNGVFRFGEEQRWIASNQGLINSSGMLMQAANLFWAGTKALFSSGNNIALSEDSGRTWRRISSGIQNSIITSFGAVKIVQSTPETASELLLAGTSIGVILQSTDNGTTWTALQTNFSSQVNSIVQVGMRLFASTNNGIAESSISSSIRPPSIGSWSIISESRFPRRLQVHWLQFVEETLLAGTTEGMYRSRDSGQSWQQVQQTSVFGSVRALAERQGVLFALTSTQGVVRSTDVGFSWQSVSSGLLPNDRLNTVAATAERLFVGTPNGLFQASLPPLSSPIPVITALSQDSIVVGAPSAVVLVQGRNFAANAIVEFGGRMVEAQVLSATQIRVVLPQSVLQDIGEVRLEITNPPQMQPSSRSASTLVRIVEGSRTAPIVLSVSPDSVFVNELSLLTIIGRNFLRTRVVINNEDITPQSASETQMIISIPARLLASVGTRRIELIQPQTNERTAILIRVVFRPELPVQLRLQPQALTAFSAYIGTPSLPQQVQISAEPVRGSFNLFAPARFQVSRNQSAWSDSLSFISDANTVVNQTVWVRFFSQDSGQFTSSLTFRTNRGTLVQSVPVRGVSGRANFVFSPARLEFSTSAYIRQNDEYPQMQVIIRNIGNLEDTVREITFDTPNTFFAEQRVQRVQPNEEITRTIVLNPRLATTGTLSGAFFGTSPQSLVRSVESRVSLVTAQRSTQAQFSVRGTVRFLPPPTILSPNNQNDSLTLQSPISPVKTGFVQGDNAVLRWRNVSDADLYEVEISERVEDILRNTAMRLPALDTTVVVAVKPNTGYHWTVRSIKLGRNGGTLVVSDRQAPAYFHTLQEIPALMTVNSGLDFGDVPRGDARRRGIQIPVQRDSISIHSISFTDTQFSLAPENPVNTTLAAFRASSEYPLSFQFQPRELGAFQGRAVLTVQEPTRRYEWSVPLRGRGVDCGNNVQPTTSCPEARIATRILRERAQSSTNTTFLAGENIVLQVWLRGLNAEAQALERSLRRFSCDILIQNSSLLVLTPMLRQGVAVRGREARAVQVSVQPPRLSSSLQQRILQNTLLKIEVERPVNAGAEVLLAEVHGVATAGLRGIGTTRIDAVDTAFITHVSDPIWRDEQDRMIPNISILGARDTTKLSVNTCLDGTGAGVFSIAEKSDIQNVAPNPAQNQARITFSVREDSHIKLELVSILGITVKTLIDNDLLAGLYNHECRLDDVPAGSYFLVFTTPFEKIHRRLEVVR